MGIGKRVNPFNENNELSSLEAHMEVKYSDSKEDAFITMSIPKMKGVWPQVLQTLEDLHLEVINAILSTTPTHNFHCIHAKILEHCHTEEEELQSILEGLMFASG